MKTKIFIDFDGTMFDTRLFRDQIFSILGKAGYNHDEIMTAYQAECLDYKFSLTDLVKRLQMSRPVNLSLTWARIEQLYKDVPRYLFPDTVQFLKELDHTKYEVNLLSLGDINFQRTKVENSQIAPLFDNIYYCETQKWDYLDAIVSKNEKFIIIDDRGDTIEKVGRKFVNSLALQIARKDQDKDDPVRVVQTFNNLVIKNFKQAMMYL